MNIVLIVLGKLLSALSKVFNLGHGSTWPGHIALNCNKNFIRNNLSKNSHLKIILIAGTNGKTTTGKLIQTILEKSGYRVFQNEAGANLLNGIASSLLLHSNIATSIPYDYAVFEVDENSLPLLLKEVTPSYLLLLNLFRDQLDRYGEVNTIAGKWKKAIEQLNNLPAGKAGKTIIILNADDPQIAFISKNTQAKTLYFGLDDKTVHQKLSQHAVDSTYCPNCKQKLTYTTIYFSHLGDWKCNNCGNKRPRLDISFSSVYPLLGLYNRYNTHAAVLLAKINNVNNEIIQQSLQGFSPAFGRQETIVTGGKQVKILLSKNPTSFNESLRTIKELRAQNILFVLNDRIPDGRDVSWIWDVDFENYIDTNMNITISGDRCYDMGLRIKYIEPLTQSTKYLIQENLEETIISALEKTKIEESLYILPTYSAMLDVRKILTGKKIL